MNAILKKPRQTNLELLRVIAMLLIVAHHFAIHSGFVIGNELTFTNAFLKFLYTGGKVGVVIFVAISGYFMILSKLTIPKVIQLWSQVVFFNLVTAIVFYFISIPNVPASSIETIFKSFFPVVYKQYWFFTNYMILYLFTPFLNKMFTHINQKEFIYYLLLSLLFFSIIPTFLEINLSFDHVTRFIFYYAIGAYLRLYPPQITSTVALLISLFFYGVMFFMVFNNLYALNLMTGLDSTLVVGFSSSFLLFFSKLKLPPSKVVQSLAKTTLGVYLIHDNHFLRPLIWKTWINGPAYVNATGFFVFSFIIILLVFLGSALIESIRQKLFFFSNNVIKTTLKI